MASETKTTLCYSVIHVHVYTCSEIHFSSGKVALLADGAVVVQVLFIYIVNARERVTILKSILEYSYHHAELFYRCV